MTWGVDLRSLDGTSLLNGSTPFMTGTVTWALDGSGSAELQLRDSDVSDGRWLAGRRRVCIKDTGGTRRYYGWLDRLERSGPPKALEWRAASRGLMVAVDEAVVHGNMQQVAVQPATMVWNLINHAQNQTDNIWHFTLGTITGTQAAKTRYFCDGDFIGDSIRELSVDWEIDAQGAYNAWVGMRGTDRTGQYTLQDTQCQDWTCVNDTTGVRTYMTGVGDADEDRPCGPPLVIDSLPAAVANYGRREDVIIDNSEDEAEMEEKTTERLRSRRASAINLTTTWVEGRGPWSFGTVWLGDKVTGALGAPFGGNRAIRLISVTVTFEEKWEFVQCEWEDAS